MDANALRAEMQAGFNRLADDIRAGRLEATEAHSRLRSDFTGMLVDFTGRVVVLEATALDLKAARANDAERGAADARDRRQLLLRVIGLAISVSGLVTWAIEHFRWAH